MKRVVVALFALLLCGACACARSADYTEVSFSNLVEHPWEYDGRRVRVRGYLISIWRTSQLVNPAEQRCYSNDPGRTLIATSLPRSALGEWDGAYSEFDGHLVTMVGVFRHTYAPWPRDPLFSGSPQQRAVGPIRHARIEAIAEDHCLRIGEGEGS